MTQDNPAKTQKELADAVYKKSLMETADDVVVYTSGISEVDLRNLYFYLDKTNVKSKTYYMGKLSGMYINKVELTIQKTEAYYVYQNMVNGKEIPVLETMAKEEAEVVSRVLNEAINPSMLLFCELNDASSSTLFSVKNGAVA